MHKLCRIDIEDRAAVYERLRAFAERLKTEHGVTKVYLYGSFARGDFNEGSDIDLIIVGEFQGRMHERIGQILDLTDLPVEPLVYTQTEFEQMRERRFLQHVLSEAVEL